MGVAETTCRAIASVASAGEFIHKMRMSSLSKSERKELLRALNGPPASSRANTQSYLRGKAQLWPHACFDCRKSWKLPDASSAKCPQCGSRLHDMGRGFRAPRKDAKAQWRKVEALWTAGFRFPSTASGRDAEPYPKRLREVDDFIRRNPDHPLRISRRRKAPVGTGSSVTSGKPRQLTGILEICSGGRWHYLRTKDSWWQLEIEPERVRWLDGIKVTVKGISQGTVVRVKSIVQA